MSRGGRDSGRINGLIDKGCSLEGKLTFDGVVQINGHFHGDVISDGVLIVGPEARVSGSIRVGAVVVEGNVQGVVDAKEKIELRSGSRLVADIQSPAIVVEDGAIFHGQCHMLDESTSHRAIHGATVQQEAGISAEGDDSLMM